MACIHGLNVAAKWFGWLRDGTAEGNLKPNSRHIHVGVVSQSEGIFFFTHLSAVILGGPKAAQ